MSIIDFLTSLFAPDDCLVCGHEGSLLCRACLRQLPPLPLRCFGCHVPVASGVVCQDCLSVSGCSAMHAVANYRGAAKELVGWLKFRGNQSAAHVMADAMLRSAGYLPRDALIVHVPATTSHIRQRGYDQAALIARHLSHRTGCRRMTLLARSGQKHQLGAGRQERLSQLGSALRLRRTALVRGRHVVLVDDVLTTGSSLQAAAELLLRAGAARVEAVVFAQAISESLRK